MFGFEGGLVAMHLHAANLRAQQQREEDQRLLAMPAEQRNAVLQIRQVRALEEIARKDPTINIKTSIS